MPQIESFTHSDPLRDRILELVPPYCIDKEIPININYLTGGPEGTLQAGYIPQDNSGKSVEKVQLIYIEPLITGEEAMGQFVNLVLDKQERYGDSSLTDSERNVLRGGGLPIVALQSTVEIKLSDAQVLQFERTIGDIGDDGTVTQAHTPVVGAEECEQRYFDESHLQMSQAYIDERMKGVLKMFYGDAYILTPDHESELLAATDRIIGLVD